MPTEATNAVVNAVQSSPDDVRLSWWAGALALAGWAACSPCRHLAHREQDIS